MTINNQSIIKLEISDEIKATLFKKANKLGSPYINFDEISNQAHDIFLESLTKEMIKTLYELRLGLTPVGAALITNLPLDSDLVPTPTNGKMVKQKSSFVAEAMLIGIGRFMGYPFSYNNQHGGEFIHCVAPQIGKEKSISAFGSDSIFDFHIEATYCDFRPDFLSLLCLRENSQQKVITNISDNQNAINSLPADMVKILSQENYQLKQSEIFTNHQQVKQKRIAVITHNNREKRFCFNFNTMQALNEPALKALDSFKQQLIAGRTGIILKKGDLLLIDNNRCCHGRTDFKAFYDGNDRWLIRNYIHTKLEKSSILNFDYHDQFEN